MDAFLADLVVHPPSQVAQRPPGPPMSQPQQTAWYVRLLTLRSMASSRHPRSSILNTSKTFCVHVEDRQMCYACWTKDRLEGLSLQEPHPVV